MKLTDHTDYSLRVLMYLNQKKKMSTLNELAESLDISRNSLIKVSNCLAKNKFINTTRGKFGGLAIADKGGKITVKEVVEKTEETFNIAVCFSTKGECVFKKNCKLKRALQKALAAFLNSLGDTTIDDITPADQKYRSKVI